MTSWITQVENEAAAKVEALLALPDMPTDGMFSDGECFDPWDLFPALYGSYSSAFDEMAIETLQDIADNTVRREDLASQMFREMLCTADLCSYGTSPRVCFPTTPFRALLPKLIDRWETYAAIQWTRGAA